METPVFREAVSQLWKNRVVLISGEPGVGKTTLAEQVSLYYFAKYQFQAFLYAESMEDLYTALGVEGKKVILYDDFWGRNGFDPVGRGKRSGELVTFIEHVRKKKDCLLVLTTREYILEQGLKQNAELRRLVERYKLECRIEQYSEADKLRIYYGHLRYGGLTWEQTKALQKHDYHVICSDNYNPRVIASFVQSVDCGMPPQACVEALDRYLECPEDFWEKIVHDLSREARILYVLTAVFPMPIEMGLLKTCYYETLKSQTDSLEWKSFEDAVIELEKTVIRTDLYNEGVAEIMAVTYQNPSAKDYLIVLLKQNLEKYRSILEENCRYFAQYVEYLKLLDEIGASPEQYEEIYQRAMRAIDSESIIFYDRYHSILRYHKEMRKYLGRYVTEQDCRDMGSGRYFQLILLYKKGCGEAVKGKITQLFLRILYQIECYPESVLAEDLGRLPGVMIAAYQKGLCGQVSWMLGVYAESLMRNRMPLVCYEIERAFPGEWERYWEQHRELLADYLEKYCTAELCAAAASGDLMEFSALDSECVDLYEHYHIDLPEALKEKRELYDSWLLEWEDEAEEEQEKGDILERVKSVSEIRKEFEENFLDEIWQYHDVYDVAAWIESQVMPPKGKEILLEASEKWHILWSQWMDDEDSLGFVTAFIGYVGRLPQEIDEILREMTRYLEERGGIKREDFLEWMNGLEWSGDRKVWSERELELACPEPILESQPVLEQLTEAHILVSRDPWYRLSNPLLRDCLELAFQVSDEEKKQAYYHGICQKIRNQETLEIDGWFCELLYQLDQVHYETELLIPAAESLYQRIAKTGKPWIEALLDLLDMKYFFEEKEPTGGERNGDVCFDILEVSCGSDLFDLLTPDFTEEQLMLLEDWGMLGQETDTVSLKELWEHGCLGKLGISEGLEKLWDHIQTWKEKAQDGAGKDHRSDERKIAECSGKIF